MSIEEGIEFLNEEYAAAADRKKKVGLKEDTKYMKILRLCMEILEEKKFENLKDEIVFMKLKKNLKDESTRAKVFLIFKKIFS